MADAKVLGVNILLDAFENVTKPETHLPYAPFTDDGDDRNAISLAALHCRHHPVVRSHFCLFHFRHLRFPVLSRLDKSLSSQIFNFRAVMCFRKSFLASLKSRRRNALSMSTCS